MTDIQLHNLRARAKEPFRPLDPANVRIYVCGPTVYDRAHIGNARPEVVFDVLHRLLRHIYGAGHVTYVRNFTDVDDKIIDKAVATLRPGETLEQATRRITDETIGWYHDDMGALGALRPTHEPRCTEYIPQMVEMTRALVDKGAAYEAEGHVLFEVARWPRYGELSGRSVDDMIAGARVEVAPYKRSPMDFVLWKPSTPEQPGWPSPWGRGRPGWHIECSAMAKALLGEEFDIHGGGIDLQFPHHENELAQSCCVHGTERMAQVWMHNGFLQVEGEKMSKSLGNFITVRDLLRGVHLPKRKVWYAPMQGVEIRLALLMTHYSHPLDWNAQRMAQARKSLGRWKLAAQTGFHASAGSPDPRILDALSDDLNTPEAFHRMHALASEAEDGSSHAAEALMGTLEFFGFYDSYVEDSEALSMIEKGLAEKQFPGFTSKIHNLLARRQEARRAKDFARADVIRGLLQASGIKVEDRPDKTFWTFSSDDVDLGWMKLIDPSRDGKTAHSLQFFVELASARGYEISFCESDEGTVSSSGTPARGVDLELLEIAEKEAFA